MRRGLQLSKNEGGPHTHAEGQVVGSKAKEAPTPIQRGPWWCRLVPPRGIPIPQAAQGGPEGLRCIRRCVGVDGVCVSSYPHGAPLSPKGPRQDQRDSGVSAAV